MQATQFHPIVRPTHTVQQVMLGVIGVILLFNTVEHSDSSHLATPNYSEDAEHLQQPHSAFVRYLNISSL